MGQGPVLAGRGPTAQEQIPYLCSGVRAQPGLMEAACRCGDAAGFALAQGVLNSLFQFGCYSLVMAAGFGVSLPLSLPVHCTFLSSTNLHIFQLSAAPPKPHPSIISPSSHSASLSSPGMLTVTNLHRPRVPRLLLLWLCPCKSSLFLQHLWFRAVGAGTV